MGMFLSMILTDLSRLTVSSLPTPKFNKTLSFFFLIKGNKKPELYFYYFSPHYYCSDKGMDYNRLTPLCGRRCFPLFVSKDLELCGGKSLLCSVPKGVHILVKVGQFHHVYFITIISTQVVLLGTVELPWAGLFQISVLS